MVGNDRAKPFVLFVILYCSVESLSFFLNHKPIQPISKEIQQAMIACYSRMLAALLYPYALALHANVIRCLFH